MILFSIGRRGFIEWEEVWLSERVLKGGGGERYISCKVVRSEAQALISDSF